MIWMNFKMAMASLRSSKARSLLTMLGIIIGVASVVTVVSIGEGVKSQVSGEINRLGRDLINISPGNSITRDENGEVSGFNPAAAFGTSNLTEKDLGSIRGVDNVAVAVPIFTVTGTITANGERIDNGLIFATDPELPEILKQEVKFGSFLSKDINNDNSIVVGFGIAEEKLEGVDRALGRKVKVRGEEFTVIGVMEEQEANPLAVSFDYNQAVYIPFETGKKFNEGVASINEINVRVTDVDNIDQTADAITQTVKANHGGEEDFSVIKQEEALKITDTILSLVTSFVASIAGISLLVGGIGIMNIMLVAVTERTHEIGIRKSIGATNTQIMSQFLIEAIVISITGGLIGVLVSVFASTMVRVYTDLEPAVTLPIILVATGVSSVVGIIFGSAPAIKAARKNPIDALRHI